MAQIIANDEKQEVTLPLTLAELIKINKVFPRRANTASRCATLA